MTTKPSTLFTTMVAFVSTAMSTHDPSHNPTHVHRVVTLARKILAAEQQRNNNDSQQVYIPYDPHIIDFAALLQDIGDQRYSGHLAAATTATAEAGAGTGTTTKAKTKTTQVQAQIIWSKPPSSTTAQTPSKSIAGSTTTDAPSSPSCRMRTRSMCWVLWVLGGVLRFLGRRLGIWFRGMGSGSWGVRLSILGRS